MSISLNVGGTVYTTTISTLAKYEGLLRSLFSEDAVVEEDGHVVVYPGPKTTKDLAGLPFIDRDGPAFGCVLSWLRTGVALVPPGVHRAACQIELDYYFPGPECPLAMTPEMVEFTDTAWWKVFLQNLPEMKHEIGECLTQFAALPGNRRKKECEYDWITEIRPHKLKSHVLIRMACTNRAYDCHYFFNEFAGPNVIMIAKAFGALHAEIDNTYSHACLDLIFTINAQ